MSLATLIPLVEGIGWSDQIQEPNRHTVPSSVAILAMADKPGRIFLGPISRH